MSISQNSWDVAEDRWSIFVYNHSTVPKRSELKMKPSWVLFISSFSFCGWPDSWIKKQNKANKPNKANLCLSHVIIFLIRYISHNGKPSFLLKQNDFVLWNYGMNALPLWFSKINFSRKFFNPTTLTQNAMRDIAKDDNKIFCFS